MKLNKLFMVMFVMVLLVGTISAFEFDNVGNYDEKTKTMKIKNAFGLGEDLIEAKLNSENHEVIKFLGYVKIAEVEVLGKNDYGTFFKKHIQFGGVDHVNRADAHSTSTGEPSEGRSTIFASASA